MPATRLNTYWRAINTIEAKDTLLKLRIAIYSKLSKGDQKKFFDSVYKKAYPNYMEKAGKALTSEDFAKALKNKGF